MRRKLADLRTGVESACVCNFRRLRERRCDEPSWWGSSTPTEIGCDGGGVVNVDRGRGTEMLALSIPRVAARSKISTVILQGLDEAGLDAVRR